MQLKEIYQKSHMPKGGWFQGCFLCSTITARTEKYNGYKKNYKVYLCPYCGRNLKITEDMRKKLNTNIIKYIDNEDGWINKKIIYRKNKKKLMQEIDEKVLTKI